eukprot:gene23734-9290_t
MSKKPPRSSTMGESATGGRGQGSGAAPRMSARGGAPRTSNSGGVRGMRASHRQSSVGRGGTQLTEEATGLQTSTLRQKPVGARASNHGSSVTIESLGARASNHESSVTILTGHTTLMIPSMRAV